VAYVRRRGGRRPLLTKLLEPLSRAFTRLRLHVSVAHLPGIENTIADALSRSTRRLHDYSLTAEAYKRVVSVFGQPSIDLFATHHTAKTRRFVSYRPDPFSSATDAFSFVWTNESLPYAFPPFLLTLRVIEELNRQQPRALLLVFPWWPSQAFFPLVMRQAISPVLHLGSNALQPSPCGQLPLDNGDAVAMAAVLIAPDTTTHSTTPST